VDCFSANGPEGSAKSASKSRWLTGKDFLLFMEHFMKHTRVTDDRLLTLLPENDHSRLAVKVLHLAKEIGLVLLTSSHCNPWTGPCLEPLRSL
jgi:hypothetical protein